MASIDSLPDCIADIDCDRLTKSLRPLMDVDVHAFISLNETLSDERTLLLSFAVDFAMDGGDDLLDETIRALSAVVVELHSIRNQRKAGR